MKTQSPDMRALLTSIVESSDDAIFSKTLDGVITSWNPAAERMYGYRASEIIGQSVELIISLNFFDGCRQRRKGVFGPEPDQSGRPRDVSNDRSGNLSGWPE